jgi:hypothetical protein
MLEPINDLIAPFIALLVAILWAEVKNRISFKKTEIKVEEKFNKNTADDIYRSNVKRNVDKHFNIIKANLYENIDRQITSRQDSGITHDRINMLHGVMVNIPLDKRSHPLREGVRTVIEDMRAWVKHELISEPLIGMNEEDLTDYIQLLTKTIRETIENDMIKQAYKSPVLEDVFLEFNYSNLLDK